VARSFDLQLEIVDSIPSQGRRQVKQMWTSWRARSASL